MKVYEKLFINRMREAFVLLLAQKTHTMKEIQEAYEGKAITLRGGQSWWWRQASVAKETQSSFTSKYFREIFRYMTMKSASRS